MASLAAQRILVHAALAYSAIASSDFGSPTLRGMLPGHESSEKAKVNGKRVGLQYRPLHPTMLVLRKRLDVADDVSVPP